MATTPIKRSTSKARIKHIIVTKVDEISSLSLKFPKDSEINWHCAAF